MVRRCYSLLVSLLVLTIFFVGKPAFAFEESKVSLDQATVSRGYTLRFADDAVLLAVTPETFDAPTDISFRPVENPVAAPQGFLFSSSVFRYDVHQAVPGVLTKPLFLSMRPNTASGWKKRVAFYDSRLSLWRLLPSKVSAGRYGALLQFPSVDVAILDEVGSLPAMDLTASAAAVYNPVGSSFLATYHGDEVRSIASITKLMTAMIVLDEKPLWERVLIVQKTDDRPGARLSVRPREQLTVRDAWHAMLLGSANNAAMMLARSTGMTEAEFVSRMNQRAQSLGLTRTTFVEPTGLDPRNSSTAIELAKLTEAAFARPEIRDALHRTSYRFVTRNTRRAHLIKTTNALLGKEPAVIGGKTGFLNEAGYCLVLFSTQESGASLITVILGNVSSSRRFSEAAALTKAAAAAVAYQQ